MFCSKCGRDTQYSNLYTVPADDPFLQSSRAHELLSSNNRPSDEEICQMRQKRTVYLGRSSTTDQEISRLETVLARMTRTLSALKEGRNRAVQHVQTYTTLLHPIKRLPNELLCSIFLACLNQDFWNSHSMNGMLCNRQTLRSIMQVCHGWRSVAVGYPQLWACIAVDLDNPSRGSIRQLSLELENARTVPLTVWIQWTKTTNVDQYDPLVQVLYPSSTRWKQLIVKGMPSSVVSVLSPIRASLASLQSLRLQILKYGIVGRAIELEQPLDAFEFAPNLQRVSTSNIHSAILPWNELRKIEILDHCRAFPLDILHQTPNLEWCSIIVQRWENHTSIPSMLTLDKLTELTLWEQRNGDISSLADYMLAPNLETLRVGDSLHNPACIASLIRRSGGSLTCLTLHAPIRIDGGGLEQILEATPRLRKLSMNGENAFTSAVLERLTYSTSRPSLGTHLQSISVFGNLPCTPGDFLDMVESRRKLGDVGPFSYKCGRLLEELCLSTVLGFKKADISRLVVAEKQGLKFKIAHAVENVDSVHVSRTSYDLDESSM